MPTERSSDVIEQQSAKALGFGIEGIVALAVGAMFVYYGGMGIGLGIVLTLAGLAGIGYAVYIGTQTRKVPKFRLTCPYCSNVNVLTAQPERDFSCTGCHRMIGVVDGRMLRVFQVRCGFCNHLNYYSEKSTGLICEECDRVIPIATDAAPKADAFRTFAQHDDDQQYELILLSYGHKTEEVISCLQHMLALNRNQVKDMLGQLPVTLLTGIPRKKAEMLSAQLASHEAAAEFRPVARI
jgi:ribosomal protein S27E